MEDNEDNKNNENLDNNQESRSLYDRFDDTVMKGVNAYVRAYNWTTGKTKYDLANSMLIGGSIISSTGMLIGASMIPRYNLLFAPFCVFPLIGSHIGQKKNYAQKKLEEDAQEKHCKSLEVEKMNESRRKSSLSNLGWASMEFSLGSIPPFYLSSSLFLSSFGTHFLFSGVSDYVMRAENLPPKKSVFSRAWEKGKNLVGKLNESPEPAIEGNPVPVQVENRIPYSQDIGDYLPITQENLDESEMVLETIK